MTLMSNYIPHRQWHLKVAPDRRFMSYVQANFLGHPPVNNTYGIVNINGFDYAPRHQPHNILWMLPWLTWAGHNNELSTRLLYGTPWQPNPANWRSRSVSVCFTCARNIVFEYKINFCVDAVRMVCLTVLYLWVHIGFVCVYFEFTFYRVHGELKMVSNQHIVNTRSPEHTLAPICWENLKNWLNNLILKQCYFWKTSQEDACSYGSGLGSLYGHQIVHSCVIWKLEFPLTSLQ